MLGVVVVVASFVFDALLLYSDDVDDNLPLDISKESSSAAAADSLLLSSANDDLSADKNCWGAACHATAAPAAAPEEGGGGKTNANEGVKWGEGDRDDTIEVCLKVVVVK